MGTTIKLNKLRPTCYSEGLRHLQGVNYLWILTSCFYNSSGKRKCIRTEKAEQVNTAGRRVLSYFKMQCYSN